MHQLWTVFGQQQTCVGVQNLVGVTVVTYKTVVNLGWRAGLGWAACTGFGIVPVQQWRSAAEVC